MNMKTIKLYNGVEIPQIGYGAMVAPADTEQIKTLDTGRSILFDHHDGDTTKMFMGWRNIEDLYKQV